MKNKKQKIIILCCICILIVGTAFCNLVFRLNNRINNSLEKGWFTPPIKYYTAPEILKLNNILSPQTLEQKLKQRYYIKHRGLNPIMAGYFVFQKNQSCKNTDTQHCIEWKDINTDILFRVGFTNNHISFLEKNNEATKLISLKPFLFAQYENNQPILKKYKPLNVFPFYCLQAVLIAEDNKFIIHDGINLKSILRATWKNLSALAFKEGGSTITQQLIKNIFFNQKKTLTRKFQEQIMAILLEQKMNKDQILEAYLNVVYMGQKGVFRIYGFSSAAEYYIGKPLSKLNLGECALMASLLKSPGKYKPSAKNKKTLTRRNHILHTLYKKHIINQQELQKAQSQPIVITKKKHSTYTYFTDAVYKKLTLLKLPHDKGLKIFTTLNLDHQEKATLSVTEGLQKIQKHSLLKQTLLKQNTKDTLQAALISVNIPTGAVHALVGGSNFKISQFNRVLQARRQMGSLIKPIVILSALINNTKLHAQSLVEDKKFKHKYDNSSWSPKNYNNQYHGYVPLYKLLTLSLNAGTAKLGLNIGLKPLINTLKKLGKITPTTKHPSILLGALEMNPWEITQMFLTLANMGTYKKQHIIQQVSNLEGKVLYKNQIKNTQVLNPKKVAIVIGMLKEVTKSGTAKSLKNFPIPVAGKTGTTNKARDIWFVGFTPNTLTLVWLGFDYNYSTNLTGASGALPIWKTFMYKILGSLSPKHFTWPKGVISRVILAPQKNKPNYKIPLIFEQ